MNNCTWEQSQRAIVIDFEGEGKRNDGTTPDPILLGAWGPFGIEGRMRYKAWLLDPQLESITRTKSISGQCVVSSLEEALEEILDHAERLNVPVAMYSEHELNMAKEKAPQLVSRLESVGVNIRKMAKAECSRRKITRDIVGKFSLHNVIQYLKVGTKPPVAPEKGPAEACRVIKRAAAKSRRWKNWNESARSQARELLRYNREDVKTTYKVMRHCCWSQNNRGRS